MAHRDAAEEVPELEVPPVPTLSTRPCGLRQKQAELHGHVDRLAEAVDRASKILELVPRTDPAPPAGASDAGGHL